MLKIRFLRLFGIISLVAVVNIIRPPKATAIGLIPVTDTPESLNIPFGVPSPLTVDGVPSLVFNGQNWNIFVSQANGLRREGGFAPLYYVQQDSSGSTDESNGVFNPDLPTGVFWYEALSFPERYRDSAPPLEFSYLSNAPGGTLNNVGVCPYVYTSHSPDCFDYRGAYDSVTCVKGTPGCVFYTFNRSFPPHFEDSSGQLIADYQPLESSENVPEPLTIAGSVLALGLGKRFLSKSNTKRRSAKLFRER
jgi:hypothetical protein